MKKILQFPLLFSILILSASFFWAEENTAEAVSYSFWEDASRVIAIPKKKNLELSTASSRSIDSIDSDEAISQDLDFDETILHVLKSYYQWYYDGFYAQEKNLNIVPLVRDNALYLRYWKRMEIEDAIFLYTPQSNIRDIAIIPAKIDAEVLAFILTNEAIYPLRYWLTNESYDERKASVKLSETKTVFVDAYLSFGDVVYTSVTGKRNEVRNLRSFSRNDAEKVGFYEKKSFDDGKYLVMSEPDFTALDLDSMLALQALIDTKNARRKPPRAPLIEYQDLNFYYDVIEKLRR